MDDLVAWLVSGQSVWRAGRWVSVGECRAQARRCARQIPRGEAVVPTFRDQGRFAAAFIAAVAVGARCLFLSDRSPATLERLSNLYAGLRLLTDEHSEPPPFTADMLLDLDTESGDDTARLESAPGPEVIVVIAYTSGSTGVPKAYSKTWSALVAEADMIGRALRLPAGARHLVSTVPPHHMYGFAYGLFGPLRWGMSIDAERPVYPKDLARVLRAAPGPSWVVTTPNQLRAYVASSEVLHGVAGFVCSAAPLPLELAEAAEARFGQPLIETYGSTETGAIAWRRPTCGSPWNLYDGLTVTGGEQTRVHAAYLPSGGQPVDDEVEILGERQFRVIGRSSDLVKIGGKRASLADLTERLRGIAGVLDAAYYLPPDLGGRVGQVRLVAFAVSGLGDAETILARLRERIDPVFLPRPLILVSDLPRGTMGKLPRSALEQLWREHCNSPAGAT